MDAENDDLNNPIKNLFVKVNVIIMKRSTQVNDEIKSLCLEVNEKTRIYDLIKMSLENFNETFSKENLNYRLDPDYRLYSVKPSKKSGKPDKDLPSKFFLEIKFFYFFFINLGFDNSVFVSQCFSQQYTLIARACPDNYGIYLRLVRKNSGGLRECKRCNIL